MDSHPFDQRSQVQNGLDFMQPLLNKQVDSGDMMPPQFPPNLSSGSTHLPPADCELQGYMNDLSTAESSSTSSLADEPASTEEHYTDAQSTPETSLPVAIELTSSLGSSSNGRSSITPRNSGICLLIEFIILMGQIIASVVVLATSRKENPHAPLGLWILGYACGCCAFLPLLYWRYLQRNVGRTIPPSSRELGDAQSPVNSPIQQLAERASSSDEGNHQQERNQDLLAQGQQQFSATNFSGEIPRSSRWGFVRSICNETRIALVMERCKIALDFFFAVLFVFGNVWIFGGQASPGDAPNQYRLCIVFLALSCLNYAMPFILCATICCCLPCIIALMSYAEEPMRGKGASADVIAALPSYKFKSLSGEIRGRNRVEEVNDKRDLEEGPDEGGLLRFGTPYERVVSNDDAVCCICLGQYIDGIDLRELPCGHHFHLQCVDTWLKINDICPMCKRHISEPTSEEGEDHA